MRREATSWTVAAASSFSSSLVGEPTTTTTTTTGGASSSSRRPLPIRPIGVSTVGFAPRHDSFLARFQSLALPRQESCPEACLPIRETLPIESECFRHYGRCRNRRRIRRICCCSNICITALTSRQRYDKMCACKSTTRQNGQNTTHGRAAQHLPEFP